jgi:glucokinase
VSSQSGDVQLPVTLGIDVGGTKVLGLAVDASGEVLDDVRLPTPATRGALQSESAREELVEAMATVVTQLAARVGLPPRSPPLRVGVGVPGLVDDVGVLRLAPNLPVGTGLDIASLLSQRLGGSPVVVDNDATCAMVGEWAYGAAAGTSDALMITLGTGIGGGIVTDGRVMRGTNGFAGEVGHMVVNPAGPVCPCGRRGCWERYASGSGLGRLAREAAHAGRLSAAVSLADGDPEAVRPEHVTQAALAGDADARVVLEELGWWLALGLANLAEIVDPDTIVVGGGLVAAVRLVLDPVRQAFDEMMGGCRQRPGVKILLATLGERAGAIGAAIVALGENRCQAGARRTR